MSFIKPDHPLRVLLIAIFGRSLMLIWQLSMHGLGEHGELYALSADSLDYIAPIESLLGGRGYTPDFRMPGYGIVYLVLRLMLDSTAALNGLVVAQVLAGASSALLAAYILLRSTGSVKAFRWGFWMMLISSFVACYDRFILTETFAAFALLFSVHAWLMASAQIHRTKYLLQCGLGLAWLVFLKPVFVVLFGVFAVAVLFNAGLGTMRQRVLAFVWLLLPFLLADAAWACRNQIANGRFQPLVPAIAPNLKADVHYPLIELMRASGASYVWWNEGSEIRWFLGRGADSEGPCPLPRFAITKSCPIDSLQRIADLVRQRERSGAAFPDPELLTSISNACDHCIAAIKLERPWHYHVVARLRIARLYLAHSGTQSLMGRAWHALGPLEKVLKLGYSALYIVFVPGAMILCLLGAKHWRRRWSDPLVPLLFLSAILVFPLVVRATEWRYLTTAYGLGVIVIVAEVVSRTMKRQKAP